VIRIKNLLFIYLCKILEIGSLEQKSDFKSCMHLYPDGSGGVYLDSVPLGTYHVIGRTGERLACSLEAEDWIDIKTPPITVTIG